MKKAVVFAPHPDDEILGCGGVMAKKLNEGYDVYVVFLTDGRNCLRKLGIWQPFPIEIKEIRKKEAKRAARVIGIDDRNLIFLDFKDGILDKNVGVAQGEIVKILRRILPDEIYFPQKREYNKDHRITNSLVKRAIDSLDLHPLEYQYIIALLYPLNLLVRIRPYDARIFITSKLLNCKMIRLDISEFLHLKKTALAKYQSQLTILSSSQKKPVLQESFFGRFINDQEEFLVECRD